MHILLEVCVDSIESAISAREGGANRLEVCSSLATGGTTPSYGFVKRCEDDVQLPVMMMIRPHDGGFVYREEDLETMLTDVEIARSIGVVGVVFGALTAGGRVHREHCERLLMAAGSLETTFHRAFDLCMDPLQSFDEIIELGFDRLLTSGQAATAAEGVSLIAQLRDRGEDRILLMPGAGVNPQNAREIVDATKVRELHASASVLASEESREGVVAFRAQRRVASAEVVQAIQRALR